MSASQLIHHPIPLSLILSIMVYALPVNTQTLGIFDNSTDIGQVRHRGSATYDQKMQTYLLTGSGKNMWEGTDEMRYLWKSIQGDFILRAEVEFLGTGVDPHRKIGWTVRNSLSPYSPMVNAAIHGDGLVSLQHRKTIKGETIQEISPIVDADVVQLERRGNNFTMSVAKFGTPFSTLEITDMELHQEVFAGLYICSHNADVIEAARFRNVRIIKPAPADLVQYEEYLGSSLEVMDIETGHRRILLNSEHSLQAPNWSVDGSQLIYNSNGFLYNYSLLTGEVSQLNTGPAIRNNNDHVLSFDGKWLAISNYEPEENNSSTVYLLPSEGSDVPRRITRPNVGHSFLHGISPDNKKIVFTGQRNNRWNIIAVDVETGAETALTDNDYLDDGPEYAPDGNYIYFNSTRSGNMQLWRMEADGKNPTRLTFDEDYNDWFPHLSPDGKWIVFLSFNTDVAPDKHPFYKHVTLRLMPASGGKPRIIGYLYGGQGTINVPSWSPDGKQIAFVSSSGRFGR